jgi:hypothetical protein
MRREPVLLRAARQDHGHAVMDEADGFVCLGREDREIDGILFSGLEAGRLASVDASHRKRIAGF